MSVAKYLVLSGVCLGGGRDAYPGDEVDLDEQQGKVWEAQGFVRRLPDPEDADGDLDFGDPEAEHGDPEAEHGDPEAENQDPRPRRGRRR